MECRHYFAQKEFKDDNLVAIKRLTDNRDDKLHDHDFVEIVYN